MHLSVAALESCLVLCHVAKIDLAFWSNLQLATGSRVGPHALSGKKKTQVSVCNAQKGNQLGVNK